MQIGPPSTGNRGSGSDSSDARQARLNEDGRPDWDALEFELTCPRCDYNLRMLEQPRCPECGLEFDWAVLVDDRARRNPFLFEHNWRKRPIRSFLVTWFGAMRPRRFWKRVALHETPRARPLLFLLLLVGLLSIAAFLGIVNAGYELTTPSAFRYSRTRYADRSNLLWIAASLHWYLAGIKEPRAWLEPYFGGTLAWFAGVQIVGTWVFLAALRQTLGRCRVRAVQLFRVVAYAALGVALFMLPLAFGLVWMLNEFNAPGRVFATWRILLNLAPLFVPCLVFGCFVTVGLRDYVRLPRPWALGLTASFTAGLAALAAYATFVLFLVP